MKSNLVFGALFGLGWVSLSWPAQAQMNPTGSAYTAEASRHDFRRWLLHVDVANVFTNESADVAVGGAPVRGGSVSMAYNPTATFDVSYFFTPNFADTRRGRISKVLVRSLPSAHWPARTMAR